LLRDTAARYVDNVRERFLAHCGARRPGESSHSVI
jgi:hypothetical protein